MIRLRPHHLLCVLTYVGKGYSRDFVENYDRLAARIAAGEAVEIVSGPDDVCEPLLCEGDCHCREPRVDARDAVAAALVELALGTRIEAGSRLRLDGETLTALRAAFADGTLRGACDGCEWFDLCTSVAESGYADVRVRPSASPQAAYS